MEQTCRLHEQAEVATFIKIDYQQKKKRFFSEEEAKIACGDYKV